MKKQLAMLLVLLLLWPATFSAAGWSEKEPNDTMKEATDLGTLTDGATVEGTLTSNSDVDFYKVAVERGVLTLTMKEDANIEWSVELYNEQSFMLQTWYLETGKAERTFVFKEGVPKGNYFIKVNRYSGEAKNSSYQFDVKWEGATNYEQEMNDGPAVAQPLQLQTPLDFFLDDIDRQDVFSFEVKQRGFTTFSFTHLLAEAYSVEIRNAKEDVIDQFAVNPLDLKGLNVLAKHGLAPGKYYIYVYTTNSEAVNLQAQLRVDFTPNANTELEPNDTIAQANALKLGVALQGTIYENSRDDVFKFVNPAKGKRTISVSFKQSGTMMMYVYAGKKAVTTLQFDGKTAQTVTLGKGTYYMKLAFYPANNIDAFYSLRIK